MIREMNTPYFRFMRMVLGVSSIIGILFLSISFYLIIFTEKKALAGELVVLGIFLAVVAMLVASHLDVAERKILKRRAAQTPPRGGTPLFSEEAEYEAEGKKLRRNQELMDLDDAGLLRPLPFKGRGQ